MYPLVAIFFLFVAFNALFLGLVTLYLYAKASLRGRFLGSLLICAALVMIVITMEHQGWVRRVPAVYVTEELLSLLYGSLLLGFVLSSLGKKPPGPVMFTPLWLYLGLLLVAPMFEMDSLKPPLGMENIMWVQIAYYLAAVAIYVHWRLHQPDRPLKAYEKSLAYMLSALLMIHVAQIIRWLFTETSLLTEIVPLTATVFFYLFLGYALLHSRSLRELSSVSNPGDSKRALEIYPALKSVMETEKPYLRRELNPAALAALVGCSVAELREAIQYHHGGGFYPFVARYRLAEAQRLLQHPDEQRYTIEGLALQCGYASRSAFYKAFKETTGMTPAEFRRDSQKA